MPLLRVTASERVRSRASSARRVCHASSCQSPSSTAAATSATMRRWPAHSRGAKTEGTGQACLRPGPHPRSGTARGPGSTFRESSDWSDHLTSDHLPLQAGIMPLQPVTRRSVPDEVFDQVLAEVVDGQIAAGESLPSERRLAEVLGVSRPAVREALQRMAATRLVEVRHGGATTVRDFRRHAGLGLLPRLLVRRGKLDASVARSVLEARLAIGPAVAALAAARGGPVLAAALTETLDRMAATDDDVERQVHALEFWDRFVDAADSTVFRLMFNSLRAAYEPALEALAPLMAEEVGQVKAYRVLTAALATGGPDTARAAADRVLRPATESLLAALAALALPPRAPERTEEVR